VERQVENESGLRREVRRLQDELLSYRADSLIQSAPQIAGVSLVQGKLEKGDAKEVNKLASMILGRTNRAVVALGLEQDRPFLLLARSAELTDLDMRSWISQLAPLIDGRGGGVPDRAQAGGTNRLGLDRALSAAADLLEKS
jgi:alanyl-tRNA synthetase